MKRLADLLASLKFALAIVIAIAAACIVGTLLPQGSQVMQYLARHPEAAGRMELLTKLGLTRVYSCWWFTGLLCALSASLSVCTARRYGAMTRAKGNARLRISGSVVTHVSILLILFGAVIRVVWGEKGHIEFREGETAAAFVTPRGTTRLPFSIKLIAFDLEFHDTDKAPEPEPAAGDGLGKLAVRLTGSDLAAEYPVQPDAAYVFPVETSAATSNSYRVGIVRYIPDFIVDMDTREVSSRSAQPNNPAILVSATDGVHSNRYWLFARYPDFNMHGSDEEAAKQIPLEFTFKGGVGAPPPPGERPQISDFKSTLQVLEGEAVVKEKTIEVNAPLSYKGYTFYQASYDPNDLTYTVLQVVRDPGVPVVYAGFTFMIVGLAMVFYICPLREGRKPQPGENA